MKTNLKQANESIIDDYTMKLIRYKAKQLIGTAGFTESDREDIEQELYLDLIERLPKFNPFKAMWHTFIARLVDRKIANLIRHHTCEARDYRRKCCSLNEPIPNDDGKMIERNETFGEESLKNHIDVQNRSNQDKCNLAMDVEEILSKLPDRNFCQVCELLMTDNIAEIARILGIPRTTIYETIKKLRILFGEKNLQDYL